MAEEECCVCAQGPAVPRVPGSRMTQGRAGLQAGGRVRYPGERAHEPQEELIPSFLLSSLLPQFTASGQKPLQKFTDKQQLCPHLRTEVAKIQMG